MRITALEHQTRRRRVNLHLDHSIVLPLGLDICAQFRLSVGDELNADRVAEIRDAQTRHAAMASALRLLAYRPRSEAELRSRLARQGVAADILETTVGRLQELRLIDDAAFARHHVESRNRTSPRGRRLLASELRARGIDRGIAAQSVATLVEEDAAYRAAQRRAIPLGASTYAQFRRKLTDFLLRRGFDHETARPAVARAWEESGREPPSDGDDD